MTLPIGTHVRCEETLGMVGSQYLRCNAPATIQVQHKGRDEGPYWMCREHAAHNIHNRNAEDVTPEAERVKEFTEVCIGVGSGSGYKIDDRYMPEVYALLSKLEKKS
jgi:hypothetical protein